MNQNKIGKFITERRREKGLTQDDIAKRLGITSQSVSKWERGVNVPDISVLKELSGILGVTVEELLKGRCENSSTLNEKNIVEYDESKKDKKAILLIIFITGVLILAIAVGVYLRNNSKKSETNKPSQYTEKFFEVEKDHPMVNEALSYVDFMLHLNEPLVEKLFDKNETKVTEENFSRDEKMYLVLSKCSKDFGGFIYYAVDYYFKPEELEGLVFEDTSFIKDYQSEGKHYLIQDSIVLTYERNMYNATASPGGELEEPRYVFDLIDVRRNKDLLIIDFKMGYVRHEFRSDDSGPELFVYKNIKDTTSIEKADERFEFDDKYKIFKASLDEEYNKFRYTLKIVNDKVYFESIERL